MLSLHIYISFYELPQVCMDNRKLVWLLIHINIKFWE